MERAEFAIFTYPQPPLQEPDTKYHVRDITVHEVSFRTVKRQFHLRFKGIFSTQKHICVCNIIPCILVYPGSGIWSNSLSNTCQRTHECATSVLYREIRDLSKVMKYKGNQEACVFLKTVKWASVYCSVQSVVSITLM